MISNNEYWMTLDAEQLASILISRHDARHHTRRNPVYDMVIRNTYSYYSTMLEAQSWMTALNFEGDQGELVKMSVPQARQLVRQLLTLLTKQKLAFNAIALIRDQDVQEQVRIANALAKQITKDSHLDTLRAKLVERCLVQGTSFIKTTWRSDLGKPRVAEMREDGSQGVIYDGDIEISLPSFFDVNYDITCENWEDLEHLEVRVKRNRWVLAEQHPELKDEILNLPSCHEDNYMDDFGDLDDRDMVYVYEMYHKPTPALPKGRMMFYSNDQTIYYDDINRYGKIPVEQLKPEPIEGLGAGYAMLSNLLPAQEMFDHSQSCQATNQSALGVQNILNPRGSDVDVREIFGMNFIDYTPQNIPGGGAPSKLNLLETAPEVSKFGGELLTFMRDMSNINDAVSGKLPASTSGVAIATLTANALEFLSGYSADIQRVMEETMMNAINCYKEFARTERIVRITGKNFKTTYKEFHGSDLDPIQAMEMQEVNPLLQSMAGRLDIAEKGLEKGVITDMEGYVSILDGQPLNALTDGKQAQNDLIDSENDRLLEGKPVVVLATDNHPLHIMRHYLATLTDPELRLNGAATKAAQDHILEHLQQAKMTDPMLMAMVNTGMMPPPMPGPQGGGAPPPQPAPEGGEPLEPEQQPGGPNLELPEAEPAEPADDLLGRAI